MNIFLSASGAIEGYDGLMQLGQLHSQRQTANAVREQGQAQRATNELLKQQSQLQAESNALLKQQSQAQQQQNQLLAEQLRQNEQREQRELELRAKTAEFRQLLSMARGIAEALENKSGG